MNVNALVCEVLEKLPRSLQCNVVTFACQPVQQRVHIDATELQAKLCYSCSPNYQVIASMVSFETKHCSELQRS